MLEWGATSLLASVHSVRRTQTCDTRGDIFSARRPGRLAQVPRLELAVPLPVAPLPADLPAVAPSAPWPSLSPSLQRPLFPARSPLRRAHPRRWRLSAAASALFVSTSWLAGAASGLAAVCAVEAGACASRPLSGPPAIPGQSDVGLALWSAFSSIPACYAKVLWNICFSCCGRLS